MAAWKEILGWNEEQIDDLRYVGFSYLKEGKYAIATPIFEAILLLSPNSTYDWQTLGALYLETGDNLKALHTIEKALKLDPSHNPSLLNRMKVLFALGYRRQALAQAKTLQQSLDAQTASAATALLLAYT